MRWAVRNVYSPEGKKAFRSLRCRGEVRVKYKVVPLLN
jgi:hypothetical protein